MNRTSIPRLKSVRLKSGGAKLFVFDNPLVRETRASFMSAVHRIAEKREDDMVGYAVLAWGMDGGVSSCVAVKDGRWVGTAEIPDFVKTELQNCLADSV